MFVDLRRHSLTLLVEEHNSGREFNHPFTKRTTLKSLIRHCINKAVIQEDPANSTCKSWQSSMKKDGRVVESFWTGTSNFSEFQNKHYFDKARIVHAADWRICKVYKRIIFWRCFRVLRDFIHFFFYFIVQASMQKNSPRSTVIHLRWVWKDSAIARKQGK